MKTFISGGTIAAISATTKNYIFLWSQPGATFNASEDVGNGVCCIPCRMARLRVVVDVAPGTAGSGKQLIFTLRRNGANTSVQVTINETGTVAIDTTHTANFADGDVFSLEVNPIGTPTVPGTIKWYLEVSSPKSFPIFGGLVSAPSTTVQNFIPLFHGHGQADATESNVSQIFPVAGNITRMRIYLSSSPGGSSSYTYEIYVNGVGTGYTVTISAGTTTAVNTGKLAINANDLVSLSITPSGGPASRAPRVCVEYTPTTLGKAFYSHSTPSAPSTATQYDSQVGRPATTWNNTEANRSTPVPPGYTMDAIYASLATAPGTSKTENLTLRVAGADSALTLALTGTSVPTTGSLTGQSVQPNDGDLLTWKSTTSGTPSLGVVKVAYTYSAPLPAVVVGLM